MALHSLIKTKGEGEVMGSRPTGIVTYLFDTNYITNDGYNK